MIRPQSILLSPPGTLVLKVPHAISRGIGVSGYSDRLCFHLLSFLRPEEQCFLGPRFSFLLKGVGLSFPLTNLATLFVPPQHFSNCIPLFWLIAHESSFLLLVTCLFLHRFCTIAAADCALSRVPVWVFVWYPYLYI